MISQIASLNSCGNAVRAGVSISFQKHGARRSAPLRARPSLLEVRLIANVRASDGGLSSPVTQSAPVISAESGDEGLL